MAIKRKVVRSTNAQLRLLVDHMSANKLFANGEFTGPLGPQTIDVAWGRLRDFLAEHGPPKTVDQWKHTWRDLKKKAREEGAKARIALGVTGNHVLVPEVSEISKKILVIIGKESAQGLSVEGESGLGEFIALPETDDFWASPFPDADTDDTSASSALLSAPLSPPLYAPLPALDAPGPSPCLPPARTPRPARPFVLGAALRPLVPWRPTYRVLHGVPPWGLTPRPAPPPSPRPAPAPPPRLAAATSRPAPPSPAPQPPPTPSTPPQQTPAPPHPRARHRPARALEMSTRPSEQYIAGQRQEIRHLQELVAEQKMRNFLLRLKLKRRRPTALSHLRF